MTYSNQIIIIGTDHHNTLSMVKCFSHADYIISVILLGCKKSYMSKSKYIRHTYCVNSIIDVPSILNNIYSGKEKVVIISCSDEVSKYFDEHYTELITNYCFFNCGNPGLLSKFLDKSVQTKIAKEVGFCVPTTLLYNNNIGFDEFPCLIKPLKSVNGGKHIEICKNREELDYAISTFSSDVSVLLQSFIEKESEIVVLGFSFSGNVFIPGFIKKIRDTAGATSYSKVFSSENLDMDLIQKCQDLVLAMNYSGLFGIEFIRIHNGEYYFIEINLRNDATTYSLAVSGVNLPVLYTRCVTSNQYKIPDYNIKEIYSIVEFNDIFCAIRQGTSIKKWYQQLKMAECKYYYDSNDIFPFIGYLFRFYKSFVMKVVNKINILNK